MATFKVHCVSTGEDCTHLDGTLVTFPDGGMAQAYAKAKAADEGLKYKVIRIQTANDDWRRREAKRFKDGTYYPLPWDSAQWWHGSYADLNHFAHVSLETEAQVAFTPDDKLGAEDRQLRMAPGKYLQKYFRDVLSGPQIRDLATDFAAQFQEQEFGLARTAGLIKYIYTHGPSSCMARPVGHYPTGNHHPTEVYAGPDLAVAYLKDTGPYLTDEAAELKQMNHYTARVVVWPERKLYNRFYGDSARLRAALEKAGYRQGTFYGARLQRIPLKDYVEIDGTKRHYMVFPCLDNHQGGVIDDGKHLIVERNNYDMGLVSDNGYTYDTSRRCACCESKVRNGNYYNVRNRKAENKVACYDCVAKEGYVRDTYDGYHHLRRDVIDWADQVIPIYHLDRLLVKCPHTGEVMWWNQAHHLRDGTYVSGAWADKHAHYCGRVDGWFAEGQSCGYLGCTGCRAAQVRYAAAKEAEKVGA